MLVTITANLVLLWRSKSASVEDAERSGSLRFWESSVAIRILIADDDSAIRMYCDDLWRDIRIGEYAGRGSTGVEAVEKVGLFAPDLAILDLGMPIMNGFQAACEISKANPQLPLLLISVQEVSRRPAEAARGAGFRGAVTESRGHEIVRADEALVKNELFFGPEQPTSTVSAKSGAALPFPVR
jgi:CheY-like chemotaxis protein